MSNYDQQIYDGAIKAGATPNLASLIGKQARHETGNFSRSSKQFWQNNNPFGFKYTKNSRYAQVGNISPEGNAYAKYPSLEYAILDYVDRWMGLPAKKGGTRLAEFNTIPATDHLQFATRLKSYGYYHTPAGKTDQQVIDIYKRGLDAAAFRIKIVAFYNNNKKTIQYGGGIVATLSLSYAYYLVFLKKKAA